MRTIPTILTFIVLGLVAGCNGTVEPTVKPLAKGKELLTVDFQEGQTLRYKFVSSREVTLDWGQMESGSSRQENVLDKSSESMEMVVAYTPLEVDAYGLTTVKATCKSIKARRTGKTGRQSRTSKDAVDSLAGKSFTFTVHSTGRIEDYSQLDRLIKEAGEKAFRPKTRQGRIKEPDMIADFIATQWFLWDSVSSIENPIEGVSVGQTWKSKLSLPTPMVMRKARDVTYKLDEIHEAPQKRLAVIKSSYALAESVPISWPVPYTGRMQVSGRFGLLGNYNITELTGQGEELFDLEAGRTDRHEQKYRMQVSASLIFPLPGANPTITIEQKISMRRL